MESKVRMELTHMVEVKVLEECQISPPPGSAPSTSLPLTLFDIVFLAGPPSQIIWFFEFNSPKSHFMNTILPNIKHSLSLTLQHFYPLAGKLIWHQDSAKPELLYEDGDAVSLTVAETDHNFRQVSGNHARNHNVFHPLSPVFSGKSSPLLALQVTLFPNKGISIGYTFNHAVFDGRTQIHFMKSWAAVCRSEGDTSFITNSPPEYDRSAISYLLPKELITLEKLHLSKDRYQCASTDNPNPNNNAQATFAISCSNLKRLKQLVSARVQKENEVQKPLRLSSYALSCAYVWVCAIKARWGEAVGESSDAEEHFILLVDGRTHLVPPLRVTYFGNCIFFAYVMVMRSDLMGKDGVSIAAASIAREIQNLNIYREIERDMSYFMSLPPEQCHAVAGSPQFGVYGLDFGWGKPKKVDMPLLRLGNRIFLCESPDEIGGLQISLCCNSSHMESFASHFAKSLGPLSLM